ncbi:hypothetical protein RN001_003526 [Aquatica leii]|uniref:Uncharacterized protein n=1 Tax=Aquatica leii TaxID=1421715 RepID=A0AAN7QBR9_9COLE|nr:hypothetical protein RN001_003526 [Aquatica leii]
MERQAMDTAYILQFFDDLFDSVDGGGKSLRRVVHENSTHFRFWDKAIQILKHINFVNSAGKLLKPPCLPNFIKTIQNFKELYKLLKSYGFKYLQTRQFNQDPESICQYNLANKHSLRSNCENDNIDMFFRLKNLNIQINFPEVPAILYFERQALNYVTGFVMKKVKPLLKDCESCKAKVFSNGPDVNQEYTKLKQYTKQNRSLAYVGKTMQEEMRRVYKGTKIWLNENIYKKSICNTLLRNLQHLKITCTQHAHLNKVILKKIIRLNIFNKIKEVNKLLNLRDTRKLPIAAPRLFHKARAVALKKYSKMSLNINIDCILIFIYCTFSYI